MDVLKPPTDNLYKFVAISGLLIFLASFIFPQILYKDYLIKFAEIEGDLRVLENQVATLNSILDTEPEDPKRKEEDDKEINQRKTEIDKGLAEVIRKREMRVALSNYAHQWQVFGYVGMSFGLVMMMSGFYFWYSRLQRYEDKHIKIKASDSI
jgi:hypothetical protein